MKGLAGDLSVGVFCIALFLGTILGLICGIRTLGECGDNIGPGATESWIGSCAQHKSLAECVHDAAIMGCR